MRRRRGAAKAKGEQATKAKKTKGEGGNCMLYHRQMPFTDTRHLCAAHRLFVHHAYNVLFMRNAFPERPSVQLTDCHKSIIALMEMWQA